jgi:hypothetical protein
MTLESLIERFMAEAGRRPNKDEVRVMRHFCTSEGPTGLLDEDYVEPPAPEVP